MKKYKYVNLDYKAKDIVFSFTMEHRDIIDEYTEKGYHYVGFLSTEISAQGCLRKIDLIFEKEI